MDSPSSIGESSTARIITRSSMIDSIKGCALSGLVGIRVDKEELRRRLIMPDYLRLAMVDAIKSKDVDAGEQHFKLRGPGEILPPEAPMVVFINPRSGGRNGQVLKERLQELMSEEQVFDLSQVKPNEFVLYGLGCLEKLATSGDHCAKETREKIRVVVAGGDGTVGWVLGCLGELNRMGREPVPPVAIVPLGTGNDLSRSFGWGGSFPFVWKSAIKRTLLRASVGPVCRLDSWHLTVQMPSGELVDPPHSLKRTGEFSLDQGLEIAGELADKGSCYEGVFYNYFSVGMDAQVAYGFHHLRNEKPHLAQGPVTNKIIYSGYSCTQGWFFTPCISDPSLRGLNNILRMYIKRVHCSEWEKIPVPTSVRSIVALNLHNYGSGRNPWGNLKPEYLEKVRYIS
ncbi:hypothetical protein SLEP1_g28614 [Rubroshorea leprosula]|uniref:Diacylglycerol kinase n=1 Tax=Rubroshorea leprosula TaxID=152421 RepID=A0AAV5K2V9_9ROSI|nr:hypothetical protein SLEP1_g28614 [Rubroshorea leprosula]